MPRTIDTHFGARAHTPLLLGVQGEHRAVCLRVHAQEVLKDWPDAVFSLIVKRADGALYPAAVQVQAGPDGCAVFDITALETAASGHGKIEIRAERASGMGDGLAKTHTLQTVVKKALGATGDPPEVPRPDWVDELLEAIAGGGSDGGGSGDGDMRRAVYDTDRSGVVDDAERLGGLLPAAYVTEETDPTIYSWAKQPTKPGYNYAEVGAASAYHVHPEYAAQAAAVDARLTDLVADLEAGKYTLQMTIKAGDFTDPTGVDIRRGAMDTSVRRIFA